MFVLFSYSNSAIETAKNVVLATVLYDVEFAIFFFFWSCFLLHLTHFLTSTMHISLMRYLDD